MAITFQGTGWPSLEKKIEHKIEREIIKEIVSQPQQQTYVQPQQQTYTQPIVQQQPVYVQPTVVSTPQPTILGRLERHVEREVEKHEEITGDTLRNGQRLHHHQRITSQNGRFHAIMQGDGNFVVYEGTRAVWASNTTNGLYITPQSDHNLVIYDRENRAVFMTNTQNRGSNRAHLIMQNDANLVLYDGSAPIWSSLGGVVKQEIKQEIIHHHHRDTLDQGGVLKANEELRSQDGRYRAVMQADGNFVVYGGRALWASNTMGHGGHYVILQDDHNLVVYDHHRGAKWASGTNGRGHQHVRLVMQNDGNLVLYDTHNRAHWASNTNGQY
jgi:hypothetical protein